MAVSRQDPSNTSTRRGWRSVTETTLYMTMFVASLLALGMLILGSCTSYDTDSSQAQSVAAVSYLPGTEDTTMELGSTASTAAMLSGGCPLSVLSGTTVDGMTVAVSTSGPGCALQLSVSVGPGQFSNYGTPKVADVHTFGGYHQLRLAVQVCNASTARCEVALFKPQEDIEAGTQPA